MTMTTPTTNEYFQRRANNPAVEERNLKEIIRETSKEKENRDAEKHEFPELLITLKRARVEKYLPFHLLGCNAADALVRKFGTTISDMVANKLMIDYL